MTVLIIAIIFAVVATAADIITTVAALQRGFVEGNPIYGTHPSLLKLVAISLGFIVALSIVAAIAVHYDVVAAAVPFYILGGVRTFGAVSNIVLMRTHPR